MYDVVVCRDISMQNQDIDDNILDPRCLSPLDRSREKRKLAFKIKPKATKQQTPQVERERRGTLLGNHLAFVKHCENNIYLTVYHLYIPE